MCTFLPPAYSTYQALEPTSIEPQIDCFEKMGMKSLIHYMNTNKKNYYMTQQAQDFVNQEPETQHKS